MEISIDSGEARISEIQSVKPPELQAIFKAQLEQIRRLKRKENAQGTLF